jgi:hypothetical protein
MCLLRDGLFCLLIGQIAQYHTGVAVVPFDVIVHVRTPINQAPITTMPFTTNIEPGYNPQQVA